MKTIKVLIVDDSAMMRKAIRRILETDSAIEVVGMARDGEDAIKKDTELCPDVVTMDINMPVMDGITCMMHLFEQHPEVRVIMLSSLTQEGALTTFEALELGAFDYVGKPSGTVSNNLHIIGKELLAKIKASMLQKKRRRSIMSKAKSVKKDPVKLAPVVKKQGTEKIVVIGVSTGGPGTLMDILPHIPSDLDAAIVVVQHMPPTFTASFAKRLHEHCKIPFKEAEHGDALCKGQGMVAPGGLHLVVRKNINRSEYMVRLTTSPEGTLFTPSVDVTMHSILESFGSRTVGVLLTGMGSDGAEGMVAIRKAGGVTIAESESTAVVFGMPREAIERGGAEIIAPSYNIAKEIVKAVNRI
ncbi:chemotaxis response regulator protein-glutamate methylesterase [Pelosinus sp. sgz500959]|uniref:protein-glutamate methylesterase/protein-glutamine glutaminase n=1 Tax=Pelosinus sp. sgz500959 TaxID=3242472 RepID=UPI00366B94C3